MSNIFWVVLYFALTACIGIWMMRKKSSVADFFVAKKGLSWLLIIPLLFAEMIAGAGTVGNAGDAFKYGISSVWMNWGMSLGVIFVLVTVTIFYRVMGNKKNVISVPEAFKHRFDQKTRMVMMAILVLVYIMLFAMQPIAAASILAPMLGIAKMKLVWIMGILFILLTVTGGMKGLAWMNVLHSTVMYLGLGIVAYVSVKAAGGIGHMQAVLPPSFFEFTKPSLGIVIGTALGTCLSYACASTVVSTIFGGATMKDVKKGFWGASILVLIFALFPALIGIAAKVVMPKAAAASVLYTMANYSGNLYGVLAAMGVLAAILSTAPALLLITATMLTRDFFKSIKPDATEKQERSFANYSMIALGLIATYMGMNATSILAGLVGAFNIRAIAGLVLAVSLVWPRVDSRAAFWSMLLGGLTAGIWHFSGNPYSVSSLWPSLIVGVPLLVGLTLMAKNPESDGYLVYKQALEESNAEGGVA
ncbi:MAG: sodium:proline symporter [Firmicutes bacterium HGW-Firmicutes-15]|nr:MAG: sodium:proline symporter [Firmicutes bacterium HGW-Firmicutes-15]